MISGKKAEADGSGMSGGGMGKIVKYIIWIAFTILLFIIGKKIWDSMA